MIEICIFTDDGVVKRFQAPAFEVDGNEIVSRSKDGKRDGRFKAVWLLEKHAWSISPLGARFHEPEFSCPEGIELSSGDGRCKPDYSGHGAALLRDNQKGGFEISTKDGPEEGKTVWGWSDSYGWSGRKSRQGSLKGPLHIQSAGSYALRRRRRAFKPLDTSKPRARLSGLASS